MPSEIRTNAQVILETVSWLEENIREEISIPRMAAKSGYSLHHFTRLFSGVTGLSPRDYFEKRKLSEAARTIAAGGTGSMAGTGAAGGAEDLAAAREKSCETPRGTRFGKNARSFITDVAFEYGYRDLETFTRAFTRVIGVSPSAVKRGAPFAYHPPAVSLRDGSSVLFTIREQPRIETVPAVVVAGWSVRIKGESGDVGRLWNRFLPRAESIPGVSRPIRFTQIASLPDSDAEENAVEIMVGAELEKMQEVPVDLSIKVVPESPCLIFTHCGPVTRIPESYRFIYAEWLPASEHRPGLPFSRERYLPDAADLMSEDYRFEILVPILR